MATSLFSPIDGTNASSLSRECTLSLRKQLANNQILIAWRVAHGTSLKSCLKDHYDYCYCYCYHYHYDYYYYAYYYYYYHYYYYYCYYYYYNNNNYYYYYDYHYDYHYDYDYDYYYYSTTVLLLGLLHFHAPNTSFMDAWTGEGSTSLCVTTLGNWLLTDVVQCWCLILRT